MPRAAKRNRLQSAVWEAEAERIWAECGARLGALSEPALVPGVISGATLPRLVALVLELWRPAVRGAAHRGGLHVNGHRLTRKGLGQLFGRLGFPERSGQSWQRLLQIFGACFAATTPTPQRAERITALLREVLLGEGDQATATLGGLWKRARGTPTEPGAWWGACLRRPEPSPAALKEKWLTELRDDLWSIGWPEPARVPLRRQRRAALLHTVTATEFAPLLAAASAAWPSMATAASHPVRLHQPPPARAEPVPSRGGYYAVRNLSDSSGKAA